MPVKEKDRHPLIGVIDDGTSNVRFVIYKSQVTEELCSHQIDKVQSTPQEGWWEQDAMDILNTIKMCVDNVMEQLRLLGYEKEDIITLGITNQRETTIAWDKYTGKPLYPAIIWNDIRTDVTVDQILAKIPDRNKDYLKSISGLPISPYFSALKMRWMKDNVKSIRKACREKRCLFGTVDSWIVWNLTGGANGGLHITDVTNASRTLLMNIETLNWDPMLCRLFSIHPDLLPEIRSSSEIYGKVNNGSILDGITISGILGNQQSALVGHMCLKPGQAKNTYRGGCFLLCNTGTTRVQSSHGLVTTVAYKMGKDEPTVYAIEGSIAVAGSALRWLRDGAKILQDVNESEKMAEAVSSTGDVYFVPAFSGLYAPYWRKDARGIMCGLTAFTTKNHIIRAALESVCFQTRDILEAMHKDCGFALNKLHVDGKMTSNDLLMQLQADIIGIPVLRSRWWDLTALGVGVAAGRAVGAWIPEPRTQAPHTTTFLPTTTQDERDARYTKWKMAVQRSLGWATTKKSIAMTGQDPFPHKPTRRIQRAFTVDGNHNSLYVTPVDKPNSSSRRNSIDIASTYKCSTHSIPIVDELTVRKRSNSTTSSTSSFTIPSTCELDVTVEDISDEQRIQEEFIDRYVRKYSLCTPVKQSSDEQTILDHIDYFSAKKECDFGVCTCCIQPKVKLKNWESIDEIIDNDPEIVFDADNKPIVIENFRESIANGNILIQNNNVCESSIEEKNAYRTNLDVRIERKSEMPYFVFVRNLYSRVMLHLTSLIH